MCLLTGAKPEGESAVEVGCVCVCVCVYVCVCVLTDHDCCSLR